MESNHSKDLILGQNHQPDQFQIHDISWGLYYALSWIGQPDLPSTNL